MIWIQSATRSCWLLERVHATYDMCLFRALLCLYVYECGIFFFSFVFANGNKIDAVSNTKIQYTNWRTILANWESTVESIKRTKNDDKKNARKQALKNNLNHILLDEFYWAQFLRNKCTSIILCVMSFSCKWRDFKRQSKWNDVEWREKNSKTIVLSETK